MKQQSKLKSIMGRYFRHKTHEEIYRFIDYRKEKDQVTITTDREELSFSIYDINVFLEQFDEVETRNDVVSVVKDKTPSAPVITTVNPDILGKLSKVLLENIDKVQQDPAYVGQAKQIANSVNTLISLTMLEHKLKSNI